MRGESAQRRIFDARAARTVGRSPYSPRQTASQIAVADFEAQVVNLPVPATALPPLQNADGTLNWTLGIDDFSGGAVLG